MSISHRPDGPIRPDGLADQEYQIAYREAVKALLDEVAKLPDRECLALTLFFGIGGYNKHTVAEIAERMNITNHGVSVVMEKALRHLRKPGVALRLKRAGVFAIFGVRA